MSELDTEAGKKTAELQADNFWAFTADEVVAKLGSSVAGLSGDQVKDRIAEVGPNELAPTASVPGWKKFLKHFDDVLIYILLVAAVLKAISSDWVDFTVIMVVTFANALIGFIQEGRAQDALASLRVMMKLETQVHRDGQWKVVPAAELVPGDVIRLRSGDRVPADARLLNQANLQVDEAALTGESEPSVKQVDTVSASAPIGDRSCMIYSGTILTSGNCDAVVVTTGGKTEIGRISELVSQVGNTDTPLSRQLAKLAKQLSIMIGIMAGVMLIIGRLVHDFAPDELLSAAIGFAVAAVPEGLPALVTITLALGVQQMAHRKAITRKMSAVETLGSVTTICSDKTGTLTQNEMTAVKVVTHTGSYDITGTGHSPVGEIVAPQGSGAELDKLLLAVGACNDAQVEQTEQNGWRVVGQPTEGALKVVCLKADVDLGGVDRQAQIPFDSKHKFSATLDIIDNGAELIHVVGAPDRLLDRSSSQLANFNEGQWQLAELDKEFWVNQIKELSNEGLRVLAAASKTSQNSNGSLRFDQVADGLVFLGLVGIVDPPRPEVKTAIAESQAAGIRVKMITGDHAGTAIAIARELGIVNENGAVNSLTGAELEAMSQDELREKVQDIDVYARTSPEHKLRIVKALQAKQEVVAMTGDGVNDAPSITRADVGIAMGIKGTEATKDAADIVLADDNFTSIERAIEEGRRIYDNIRKSVVFLLPTNGAQSLVILVAVLLGLALPLSPVQILWVNLVTAVTLSLSLAGEPAEPGIMKRKPRDPKEQVLSKRSLVLVFVASILIGGTTLAVYLLEREGGNSYGVAQTTAVTMLALGQLAFLLNCRFLNNSSLTWRIFVGNKVVWISTVVLLILQAAFIYLPFMNNWFDSAPIGLREWGLTILMAFGVFLVMEACKAITSRIFHEGSPKRDVLSS